MIGGLDTLGTQGAADVLAEGVAGARIVRLPDVAHIVGLEAPERLAALISEFAREPVGDGQRRAGAGSPGGGVWRDGRVVAPSFQNESL